MHSIKNLSSRPFYTESVDRQASYTQLCLHAKVVWKSVGDHWRASPPKTDPTRKWTTLRCRRFPGNTEPLVSSPTGFACCRRRQMVRLPENKQILNLHLRKGPPVDMTRQPASMFSPGVAYEPLGRVWKEAGGFLKPKGCPAAEFRYAVRRWQTMGFVLFFARKNMASWRCRMHSSLRKGFL